LRIALGELTTVHRTRHDHVGEQKIERLVPADQRERLGGVGRSQRDVAERM
jgi:hypothetical protein